MAKIVVKIGTNVLTTDSGKLDLNSLRNIVNQIALLKKEHNHECIIVTSGAITCGAEKLGLIPETIPEKQAAASIGQLLLMQEYAQFFTTHGLTIGQLLVTRDGMEDPKRQNHILNTLNTLLEEGIVPIINENDSVSTEEIKIGDNDELSSVVTTLIKADRYILLTNTDGLYRNFNDPENKELIKEVKRIDQSILDLAGGPTDKRSSGGMYTKVKAAQHATKHGIPTQIVNGRNDNSLLESQSTKTIGTRFLI